VECELLRDYENNLIIGIQPFGRTVLKQYFTLLFEVTKFCPQESQIINNTIFPGRDHREPYALNLRTLYELEVLAKKLL